MKNIAFYQLLLLLLAIVPLTAKTIKYSHIDVEMKLLKDNTISVIETQKIAIDGDWNGVFREYNLKGCDSITIESVSVNNTLSLVGDINNKGNHTILTDKKKVLVRLRTRDRTETPYNHDTLIVVIKYTIYDAVAHFDGYSSFKWKPLFEPENGKSIESASVSLFVPVGGTIDEVTLFTKSYDPNWDYTDSTKQEITIRSRTFTPDELEFSAIISGNSFDLSQSKTNYHYYHIKPYIFPFAIGGTIVFLLILWFFVGRDPKPLLGSSPKINLKEIPPGLAGLLYDERFDDRDTLGTLLDLALRKYIRIDHIDKNENGDVVDSYTFTCILDQKKGDTLTPIGQKLLDMLFEKNVTPGTVVDSVDVKARFRNIHVKLKSTAWSEAIDKKWFDAVPRMRRTLVFAIGVFISFIGTVFAGLRDPETVATLLFGSLICFVPGLYLVEQYRKGGMSVLKKKNHFVILSLSGALFIVIGSFYGHAFNPRQVDIGIGLYLVGFLVSCFSPFTGKKSPLGSTIKYSLSRLRNNIINGSVPEDEFTTLDLIPWIVVMGIEDQSLNKFAQRLVNNTDIIRGSALGSFVMRDLTTGHDALTVSQMENAFTDSLLGLSDTIFVSTAGGSMASGGYGSGGGGGGGGSAGGW